VVAGYGWRAGDGVLSCWSRSCTGDPGAGFLLGGDGVEAGLQVISCRRDGSCGVEERDRVLQLAAVVAQLVCCEGVQGMLRLLDGWGLLCGRHRDLFPHDIFTVAGSCYPTCQAGERIGSSYPPTDQPGTAVTRGAYGADAEGTAS
jgi:hypothetical protein